MRLHNKTEVKCAVSHRWQDEDTVCEHTAGERV